MAGEKNTSVLVNSNSAYENAWADHFQRLLDLLGQTRSGNFLLAEAKKTEIQFVIDTQMEGVAQFEPPGKNAENPIIRINPANFENDIRAKAGSISQSELREAIEDCLLSVSAHELRHLLQFVQGASDFPDKYYLLESAFCEADAYSWQNLVEMELKSSNLRPNIKKNLRFASSELQGYYDTAIDALRETSSESEHDILYGGAAAFFLRLTEKDKETRYFDRYLEKDMNIAVEDKMPVEIAFNPQDIENLTSKIFVTSEGCSYMDAEDAQQLFLDACDRLSPQLKNRLGQILSHEYEVLNYNPH